ncbi:MAG: zinc ribbon domain-containing protein [Polyangiaceae bacterium]|nr:zinc ribbon domain-containing protein [Polyangiaceae bacterium]
MYSWGDDTSDWAKPGTYAYSEKNKAARAKDAEKAKAEGPRTYTDRGGPNEQLTNPKKMLTSQSPNPLIVAVDVTGSMQRWPAEIFDRLPLLYQTLSQYRSDLEISFVAIGDSRCDRWPLQCTSFAKGFDLETQLKALHGEGGGGDIPESYGLFAWWVQTHVKTPNADRPFLIIFGDAPMHPTVSEGEVRHYLGDEIAQPIDAIGTFRQVSRAWNTWFLRRPTGTKGDDTDKQWASAIGGQQVVHMDDEQRAVDYAMGLVARSWGHFDDFKTNMNARQDGAKVKSLAERVSSIERVIEAAKAPRVHDCPKCGAPLPATAASKLTCDYCGSSVHLPLRT